MKLTKYFFASLLLGTGIGGLFGAALMGGGYLLFGTLEPLLIVPAALLVGAGGLMTARHKPGDEKTPGVNTGFVCAAAALTLGMMGFAAHVYKAKHDFKKAVEENKTTATCPPYTSKRKCQPK